MGNFSKTAVLLFFAFFLSLAGVGEGAVERTAHVAVADAGNEVATAVIDQGEQIRFQFLHRFTEQVVGLVNSLPAPGSKQHYFGDLNVTGAIEQRIQSISTQYLLHARGICRSLSVRDIIFPFHYFW